MTVRLLSILKYLLISIKVIWSSFFYFVKYFQKSNNNKIISSSDLLPEDNDSMMTPLIKNGSSERQLETVFSCPFDYEHFLDGKIVHLQAATLSI